MRRVRTISFRVRRERSALPFLGRGIGTRKTQKDAVLEKKISVLEVSKLASIVTLDRTNRQNEVRGDISLKNYKDCVSIRFVLEGKSPNKMSEII